MCTDRPVGADLESAQAACLGVAASWPAAAGGIGVSGNPKAPAHRRTRRDHAYEIAEDYVEAVADLIQSRGVCRVTDLSDRFGVSHVTVIRTVQRLEREGLLRTAPYKPVTLTPKGRGLARRARQRHDTVYRFLLAIGVSARVAAVDAEGIEHHVSPSTLRRFRALADRGLG
jgi:DtxR family manganese transport transcriptional regulator